MRIPFRPMLATLVADVPTGRQWVYEEKYDGIRTLAARRRGHVRLWSRTLQDLTAEFATVARTVAELPGGDIVLDGEVVVFDRAGGPPRSGVRGRRVHRAEGRARAPRRPSRRPLRGRVAPLHRKGRHRLHEGRPERSGGQAAAAGHGPLAVRPRAAGRRRDVGPASAGRADRFSPNGRRTASCGIRCSSGCGPTRPRGRCAGAHVSARRSAGNAGRTAYGFRLMRQCGKMVGGLAQR